MKDPKELPRARSPKIRIANFKSVNILKDF
jgi:hypothetical protein